MWISKKLSQNKKEKISYSAEVTNTGSSITAQSSDEYRDIPQIAPQGLCYCPSSGDECVLLPVSGGVVSLGVPVADKDLNEGEIMLYSGSGSITLKNNGNIYLSGRVFINGVEY